jgi:enamine deaminase RidA (YjgF/YER057c/UK114 family)
MVEQTFKSPLSAEGRLQQLGMQLPSAPSPLGSYVEAVQTGNLLFLSGILPVVDRKPAYAGALGSQLDTSAGREAARTAALGALATAKGHLGTIDRIQRVVRLGVFLVTAEGFADHPRVADGASDLFKDVFGAENLPVRLVIGVASLPLNVPIELDVVFEIKEE